MKRRRLLATVILTVVGGVVPPLAHGGAPASAAVPAIDAFGITASGTGLVTFSTSAPAVPSPTRAISGLQIGEKILGLDVRPVTGQLFGLGSTSRLYVINPVTASASAVGGPFTPALSGVRFGFDFNPVVDRIRVTSSSGQNMRLDPDTGAVQGTDGGLNLAQGMVPTGIDAIAYTNSAGRPSSTVLYDIGSASLYTQGGAGNASLQLVGPLGFVTASDQPINFDILTAGNRREAFATIVPEGGVPGLYSIDLGTGRASLLGTTGQVLAAFALAGPSGYCGADFDAEVACVGGAGGAGPPIPNLVEDVVDAVQTPSGQGVWQVAFDGGVFSSGDAAFYGSTGGIPLDADIVGMAPTPSGLGYWFVGADGGVFNYGDAGFFRSVPGVLAPGQQLAAAVVGIVGTGTGQGYWLVAEDGGIFAFGDAQFAGSVPGVLPPGATLAEPVIGMARNEAGPGYYLVALDGGVFAFGGAPFYGSAGGAPLVAPVTDIAAAGPMGGYRLFGADGGIFTYGATFRGAIPGMDFGVGLAG